MKPGIYRISSEEYHSDTTAVSHSGLKLFSEAPRRYEWKYLKGHPDKETPAKVFGKLFHERILEPHIFNEKYFTDSVAYAICPDRRLKAYKEEFKRIEEQNPGRTLITHQDWENIHGMAQSVERTIAKNVLNASPEKSFTETTFVAHDPETGVLYKTRPDFLRVIEGERPYYLAIEVKTTDDASEEQWPRSIERYFLHTQAQMQLEGILANLPPLPGGARHMTVAVEKEGPYLSQCYETDHLYLYPAKKTLRKWFADFKVCSDSRIWPGLPNENKVVVAVPTEWFIRQNQEELSA